MLPELFQTVVVALVGAEEMNDRVSQVENHPTAGRLPLGLAVNLVFLFHIDHDCFGQAVEHTIAGAVANDKVIGERGHLMDIHEKDIFALFFFKGVDDGTVDVLRIQRTPQLMDFRAADERVV